MGSIQATSPETLFASLLERAGGNAAGAEPLDYRIPVDVYTDPARLAQERARLFLARPLPIAHVSQFPGPGSARVHDWLGLPLVTVRDRSGEIGTFMPPPGHAPGAADRRC